MKNIKVGDQLIGYNPDQGGYELGIIKRHLIKTKVFDEKVQVLIFELFNDQGILLTNKDLQLLNDKLVSDAYRKKHHLLTSADIIKIRKKRGWTQEEMSLFLSLGLKDIARYENGSVQTKSIDEKIRLLGDDRSFYPYCEVLHKEYIEPHLREKKRSAICTPSLKPTSL